ncbi:O-antigen polysaccharide polymerase Wzy [Vibrio owensii]|uniref:O-antigen polysaccharide polymerase Wzy n=1 Tax=Vibrio owensii TaxID=696485 RepID=UPI000596CEF6|nr:O-antigen polysaccharide polymerase Wzy [Vibrio owensii]
MLLSKNKLFSIMVQVYFLCVAMILLLLTHEDDVNLVASLKYLVLLQFIISYCTNYYINKWVYNIYGIFVTLFFIFIVSRVFLDFVHYSDFGKTSFFSSYTFTLEVQSTMLLVIFVSLVSLNFGFLLNTRRSSEFLHYDADKSAYQPLLFYGKLFVFIGVLPTILKSLLVIYAVMKHGYIATFLNPELFSVPVLVSLGAMFFPIGFLFCHLGQLQNRRYVMFINILFFASVLMELAAGKRGPILTQLLVLMWFFSFKYGNVISLKKMSIIALIMIVASQAALTLRSSRQIELVDLFGLFFYQQGVSVQLIGYAERYEIDDKYQFTPFDIFRPVTQNLDRFYYKITGKSYTLSPEERMEKYNNYSMRIANEVDSTKFSSGFGLGGSYLVEIKVIFGWVGLVLFNLVLGYFLARVEFFCTRHFYFFCVSFFILPDLIYLPRSYVLEFANTQMRPIILFFLCMALIKVTKKRRGE